MEIPQTGPGVHMFLTYAEHSNSNHWENRLFNKLKKLVNYVRKIKLDPYTVHKNKFIWMKN